MGGRRTSVAGVARRPVGDRRLVGAAVAALSLLAAACNGGGSPAKAAVEAHSYPFDAANFVEPTQSENPWFPLRPGIQWVREGTTEVGSRAVPHQVVTTVTDVVRVIDGVTTIAVMDRDTDSGQIAQVSIDYMAADKDGNVWLMGGYTEDYSGGEFTNSHDVFLGEATGSPGVLVPLAPTKETPRWRIGEPDDDESSAAEVVEIGASQCVPFSCYEDVLVVREGKVSALDNEFKFYAPGVGLILNSPKQDSKHQDTEELVNMTELSAEGLAEMSEEVLRLEAHARETQPEIFGPAPESTRLG